MTGYAFGSREWLAFLHGIFRERAAQMKAAGGDVSFSMCEVFTDPPAEIANDADRLVWSCVITDGEVDFRTSERDDVNIKIIADYQACLPICRFDTQGDPARAAEMGAMMKKLREAGQIEVITQGSNGAGTMPSVHDATARVTA
ncbi:MAG: hypothetical protein V4808_05570 [Pseudomonadota bacterium]